LILVQVNFDVVWVVEILIKYSRCFE